MNKAYRCSKCKQLEYLGDICMCRIGIDPRPNHREKGNASLCKENFVVIPKDKQWHEKFSWE